jgi:hypothetical protein
MARHRMGQRSLPGVAERRVAEIVSEAQSLGQIFIEAKRACDYPSDLRDFEAVRQPGAVVVAVRGDENLRLGFEPPEAHRMDDPIAVALKRAARAALFPARIADFTVARFDVEFSSAMGVRIGSVRGAGAHSQVE